MNTIVGSQYPFEPEPEPEPSDDAMSLGGLKTSVTTSVNGVFEFPGGAIQLLGHVIGEDDKVGIRLDITLNRFGDMVNHDTPDIFVRRSDLQKALRTLLTMCED